MILLWFLGTLSIGARASGSLSLPSSTWPTWNNISRAFFFGDSYTTIGFDSNSSQPSPSQPLGNPPYPGYTYSDGPNWADYLTVQFNHTMFESVDLAYGGATVDAALIQPYTPTVLSLKEQIQQEYLPMYSTPDNDLFPWNPANTLFATFIGINDCDNSFQLANRSQIYPLVFAEYLGLAEQLYGTGARNFLFVNVPPVNRSPYIRSMGAAAAHSEAGVIAAWNKNVTRLAHELKSAHHDASVFVYDVHTLFETVLDDPCSFDETCPYKNTTDYCQDYSGGTPTPTTYYTSCGIPVDEYFWLNDLHPTFRIHNVFAMKVAELLGSL